MLWQIQYFPACTHHAFLSHCAEDRGWLVLPLYDELRRRGIIPWVDRHDYPYGRASLAGLRDGILKSRHTVFLVTDNMLRQGRGWSFLELALAELLQENLREAGGVLQNVSLPLFFLDRHDRRVTRSAWFSFADRAAYHHPADGDALVWAARHVEAFLRRETERGLDNALWLEQDAKARSRLNRHQGLVQRITAQRPIPLQPLP